MDELRLPDWPPAERVPIGNDRAARYVRWMQANIAPVVSKARDELRGRYGDDVAINTASLRVPELAGREYNRSAPYFIIGSVTANVGGSRPAQIDVAILPDGRFELVPAWLPLTNNDFG